MFYKLIFCFTKINNWNEIIQHENNDTKPGRKASGSKFIWSTGHDDQKRDNRVLNGTYGHSSLSVQPYMLSFCIYFNFFKNFVAYFHHSFVVMILSSVTKESLPPHPSLKFYTFNAAWIHLIKIIAR